MRFLPVLTGSGEGAAFAIVAALPVRCARWEAVAMLVFMVFCGIVEWMGLTERIHL